MAPQIAHLLVKDLGVRIAGREAEPMRVGKTDRHPVLAHQDIKSVQKPLAHDVRYVGGDAGAGIQHQTFLGDVGQQRHPRAEIQVGQNLSAILRRRGLDSTPLVQSRGVRGNFSIEHFQRLDKGRVDDVRGVSKKNDGMLGRQRIHHAHGVFFLRQEQHSVDVALPATHRDESPAARLLGTHVLSYCRVDRLDQFLVGLARDAIGLRVFLFGFGMFGDPVGQCVVVDVGVSVNDSGHDHAALGVNLLRARPGQPHDGVIRAHRHDLAIAHGHGLRDGPYGRV